MSGMARAEGPFLVDVTLETLQYDINTMFLLWAGTMVVFMQVRPSEVSPTCLPTLARRCPRPHLPAIQCFLIPGATLAAFGPSAGQLPIPTVAVLSVYTLGVRRGRPSFGALKHVSCL